MAAAIGWYGPLIDLCKASSHIGDYIQLIVFVHKSTPVQYKISRNGGEVIRMDILVGDETRSYFPVTIWQKQMGSKVLAGHVFLFQNFKITKFGDAIEARTLHCSSLKCLLQTSDLPASKGLDELLTDFRLSIPARDKLQKVVGWVQRARLAQSDSAMNYYGHSRQGKVNWKVQEEVHSQDCSTLSELLQCQNSCKASFHASVGELFLPITWLNLHESETERMFVSRRIHKPDGTLIDDLITTGCQICGAPVNSRFGASAEQQSSIPLYCQKSSDRLHVIGLDELLTDFRLSIPARHKLQKVVGWVQRARLAQSDSAMSYYGHKRQGKVNWKVQEDMHSQDCSTLSELLQCQNSCKASFHASVGELFLPITWLNLHESETERMFVSRRIHKPDGTLIDDLITTGCQICGAPVNSRFGASAEQQSSIPLYCQKSSDRLHVIGTIYRPFLLYVWDDSTHLPILVSNKAAELLFGNISAEKVSASYKSQQHKQLSPQNCTAAHKNNDGSGISSCKEMAAQSIIRTKDKRPDDGNPNFYMIWLILLNVLLQHGKNGPLKFKARVDTNREWENGRFEMESMTIPAFRQISLA